MEILSHFLCYDGLKVRLLSFICGHQYYTNINGRKIFSVQRSKSTRLVTQRMHYLIASECLIGKWVYIYFIVSIFENRTLQIQDLYNKIN